MRPLNPHFREIILFHILGVWTENVGLGQFAQFPQKDALYLVEQLCLRDMLSNTVRNCQWLGREYLEYLFA